MNDQILALLQKLPLIPLLMAYGGYLGWDYYSFTTDANSLLNVKNAAIQSVQTDLNQTKEKVQKAKEFYRSLDQHRAELRNLAQQLDEAKASLSEQMDVPSFMRMVNAEATKVGLSVLGLKPTDSHEFEYYAEQSFDLKFHGVYVQLVVFLQRISNLETIIRVGRFNVKPVTDTERRYVELEGDVELSTYRYRGSKADDLAKAPPPAAQEAAPQAPKAGGGK